MRGSTSEEIEKALRLPHQTVSARRTELRRWGYTDYLYKDGEPTRRPTSSGSSAFVEIVTEKGKKAIKFDELIRDGADPTASHHHGNPMSEAAFRSKSRTNLRRAVLREMNRYS